jgi:hypothetical protein
MSQKGPDSCPNPRNPLDQRNPREKCPQKPGNQQGGILMPVQIGEFEVVVDQPQASRQNQEQGNQQPAPLATAQVQLQELLRRQAERMARLRAY